MKVYRLEIKINNWNNVELVTTEITKNNKVYETEKMFQGNQLIKASNNTFKEVPRRIYKVELNNFLLTSDMKLEYLEKGLMTLYTYCTEDVVEESVERFRNEVSLKLAQIALDFRRSANDLSEVNDKITNSKFD